MGGKRIERWKIKENFSMYVNGNHVYFFSGQEKEEKSKKESADSNKLVMAWWGN